jgi:pyruvate,water dikinase
MNVTTADVRSLAEVRLTDAAAVGPKAAKLGEMLRAGLPVPPGFVVTADAYLRSMEAGGVRSGLALRYADTLLGCDTVGMTAVLAESSEAMARLVRRAGLSVELAAQVYTAYVGLGVDVDGPAPVAVRPSSPDSDSGPVGAPVMHAYTTVRGTADLIERIVDCWAQMFGPRAVLRRSRSGARAEPAVAVVVQVAIPAEKAGVASPARASNGRVDRVVLEAAWGRGEVVVSGRVHPDRYVVDASDHRVTSVRAGRQEFEVIPGRDRPDVTVQLEPRHAAVPVLTDQEAATIAGLALRADGLFAEPAAFEWATAAGRTWLLEARPVTRA